MGTAKQEVRLLLDQIPDDATFEDIQYHIYVREKIQRGLKDVVEGRIISKEEMERRMQKWLGASDIRELLVRSYRLVYNVAPKQIYVLAMIHGARDFTQAWGKHD
jgi:plasmid stabilization system protein ParE